MSKWCQENSEVLYATNIDVRRFITFGVIKGFLYRVRRYPVALSTRDPEENTDGLVEDRMTLSVRKRVTTADVPGVDPREPSIPLSPSASIGKLSSKDPKYFRQAPGNVTHTPNRVSGLTQQYQQQKEKENAALRTRGNGAADSSRDVLSPTKHQVRFSDSASGNPAEVGSDDCSVIAGFEGLRNRKGVTSPTFTSSFARTSLASPLGGGARNRFPAEGAGAEEGSSGTGGFASLSDGPPQSPWHESIVQSTPLSGKPLRSQKELLRKFVDGSRPLDALCTFLRLPERESLKIVRELFGEVVVVTR